LFIHYATHAAMSTILFELHEMVLEKSFFGGANIMNGYSFRAQK